MPDQDQLDNTPIADSDAEAEAADAAAAEQAEQEHRGHIPGVSDPDAGMLLVGRVQVI